MHLVLPEQRTRRGVPLADADEAALDAHEDAQVVGPLELRGRRVARVNRTIGSAGLEAPLRRVIGGGPELGLGPWRRREFGVSRIRESARRLAHESRV